MAFDQLKTPSVRETFVRDIENKILSGELKIGEKLPPARALCGLMGVSLTIVNAGVSELVSKGFLEVKPRHGTYVADYKKLGNTETLVAMMRYNGGKLNSHDIRSFCETRIALDPFVAELTIRRASDQALDDLGLLVEQVRSAEGTEELCRKTVDFYRQLYSLSDNSVVTLLYNSTVEPQLGMYALFIRKNGADYVKNAVEEIYRHAKARDIEGAKRSIVAIQRLLLEGCTSIIEE